MPACLHLLRNTLFFLLSSVSQIKIEILISLMLYVLVDDFSVPFYSELTSGSILLVWVGGGKRERERYTFERGRSQKERRVWK